ncbi:acylneuraminate cytidylyltransferase family protein [Roseateles cavernae]|uniref:acylneuraminate cytidylyltransferase family protein n=1 Tax=Roseateles cavernae TaxID=3153578 RepID=UPI0032E42662
MRHEAIGFIPARGGSKGVPGKNKRLLAGKPLIQWSIEAALDSACIDAIVVSTDDSEIAFIARALGAEVVERPSDIAEDASPVIDAVRHAMSWWTGTGRPLPSCVALLQPTAPMRLSSDIDAAVDLFFDHAMTPVCSVVRCEDNHPARMYRQSDQGLLLPLFPELAAARRQDLPPVFHRNGAVYVFGQREIESGVIIGEHMLAYEMPASRSLNIDTELDMVVLQAVMSGA